MISSFIIYIISCIASHFILLRCDKVFHKSQLKKTLGKMWWLLVLLAGFVLPSILLITIAYICYYLYTNRKTINWK